jgi:hypothetical protein
VPARIGASTDTACSYINGTQMQIRAATAAPTRDGAADRPPRRLAFVLCRRGRLPMLVRCLSAASHCRLAPLPPRISSSNTTAP